MRAYSMDLRERVLLESDAGVSAAAVAANYHVSASWVRRLKQRRRETGEIAPRAQRYGPRPVLAPPLGHPRGADSRAARSHVGRPASGTPHPGQSGDHLARRDQARLYP